MGKKIPSISESNRVRCGEEPGLATLGRRRRELTCGPRPSAVGKRGPVGQSNEKREGGGAPVCGLSGPVAGPRGREAGCARSGPGRKERKEARGKKGVGRVKRGAGLAGVFPFFFLFYFIFQSIIKSILKSL